VAERKPFLLRLDPETFAALQSWAADDLRSVNGQVEFLLRRALRDAGRLPRRGAARPAGPGSAQQREPTGLKGVPEKTGAPRGQSPHGRKKDR
jgi:hypothetical protein